MQAPKNLDADGTDNLYHTSARDGFLSPTFNLVYHFLIKGKKKSVVNSVEIRGHGDS